MREAFGSLLTGEIGGIEYVRNLEWKKLVQIKFGTILNFLNATEKLGMKFPDCGTTSVDSEWWLLFSGGLWMLVGSYEHIAATPTGLLKSL